MRRIQDYLLVEEINKSMIAHANREETDDAILIRDAAFHYGTSKSDTKQPKKKVRSQQKATAPSSRRDSFADFSNPLSKRSPSFTSLY